MANQNRNGGRNPSGNDQRGSWRPQDQQGPRNYGHHENADDREYRARHYHDEDRHAGSRDPQRWEGSRGSELGYHEDRNTGRPTEHYGQGQSGYSAGRYGDDRAQRNQMQNRNEMVSSPAPRGQGRGDRYAGNRYEDRNELGVDDRFTGRGEPGYWADRSEREYNPERFGAQGGSGFEASRGFGGGSGFEPPRGDRGGWRPDDERLGYQSQGDSGAGVQRMGYASDYNDAQFRQDARRSWGSESQRSWGNEAHGHRGQGPHRGKGPSSYQRPDDRLREMICESLSDDDRIDATHIEVTVKNGEVTLSGSVEDRHAKRDAEDCACSVSGVRDVQNQLRVKDDRQAARMTNTGPSANVSQPAANTGQSSFGASAAAFANGKSETESHAQDKKPRA